MATNVVENALQNFCKAHFYEYLYPIFKPIDTLLAKIHQPVFSICAVGLFVCTMIWVCFILREDYVNRGRPYKSVWTDLRIWTVLSMLPHVLVYFYFR
jgi:hypothetical protein